MLLADFLTWKEAEKITLNKLHEDLCEKMYPGAEISYYISLDVMDCLINQCWDLHGTSWILWMVVPKYNDTMVLIYSTDSVKITIDWSKKNHHYQIRCLLASKSLKLWFLCVQQYDCSDIWQSSQQQCCCNTFQISNYYDDLNYLSYHRWNIHIMKWAPGSGYKIKAYCQGCTIFLPAWGLFTTTFRPEFQKPLLHLY